MIKKCPKNCQHPYQDEIHGYGNRVYNVSGGGSKARCTVCGTEISLSSSEIKDSKEIVKKGKKVLGGT